MGIRLDQLHKEVFEKVNLELETKSAEISDYLDTKIAELDVVFGLPETTAVERDIEANKRNLEKSGFIEINRNFVPIRTGEQANTGVWISNLDTNESPFEAQTVDGQKRGINVAGYNINYTKGNIGQDISKMMNLPIAPNLPVFFPEDNDMRFYFQPKKAIIHKKVITDSAINIKINSRITDDYKIDIDKMIDGDTVKYYYQDEDANTYYLNDEGRVYIETAPDDLLVEPYNRYTVDFGGTFSFEKIYNSDAKIQYVDPDNGQIFDIVKAASTDAKEIQLMVDESNVYLETMTVPRFIEQNGELVKTEVKQKMLVKYVKSTKTINGLETEILTKKTVSTAGFEVHTETINGTDYEYISDNGIDMYLKTDKIYYYYPFSKYVFDADGNAVLNGDGTQKTEIDTMYVKYIKYDDIDNKETMKETTVDNLTGGTVERDIHVIETPLVKYYTVNTLMIGDIGNTVSTLDSIGNYTTPANVNRPVKLSSDGVLTTLTAGSETVYSKGKEFYYYPEVGTKYYKDLSSNIYFLDKAGTIYQPANDVQEILMGTINNTDTMTSIEKMFYVANGLTFYIDSEKLRTYVENEEKQEIQLTDVNGYRIFEKADGTPVYVYLNSEDTLKKVTIDKNGVETNVDISYNEITPVFETEEVSEDVLNLVIPVAFNIVQGNIVLKRNDTKLSMYTDYEIKAILSLSKPLEFNEETNKGDTLYVKRIGKKDIILRMEKEGSANTAENPNADTAGDWANDTGTIVMPEPLTGNKFDWTDGQELKPGEQLSYNDIVKKDNKYFQYTGTALKYEDMPDNNKKITVQESGVFWEDVTVDELEWERKGQNYKIMSAEKGDIIRFTIIRRVWEQNPATGETEVIEKKPYTIERTALQNGENLFVLDDPNFLLDNNSTLESYILMIEKIKVFGKYEGNRANDFLLTLTGLQTVALNEDTAMIYGEDYFISDNVLYLADANMDDNMSLVRIQAPQAELKIKFNAEIEQPTVPVPFDIIKNKFDIVIPQKLYGHEYTWIMGESLPEGKTLKHGDVVFDKEKIKFYKFIGQTKTISTVDGEIPVKKESLLRQPVDIQKELLRQYLNIKQDNNPGKWFSFFDKKWAKEAEKLSTADDLTLTYFVTDSNGDEVLNVSDEKVANYLRISRENLINEATNILNDDAIDAMDTTPILTDDVKTEIKRILNTDLDQFVLKKVKYGDDNQPVLDEDGNIVYYYEYTRTFMVETNENNSFIRRTITGAEFELTNTWDDITVENVGYYRFGKTFTILDTKSSDEIVVRLLSTGAEEFTSKSVISEGGEITFSVDFNIEEDDGTEIPFEVIYNEINWTEGLDYIQEGQNLTLNMVEKAGQPVIIRRNDNFDLNDIVVLERKDLVFIEVWHEVVSETDFIFPFGNVQYQGTTADNITTSTFDHEFFDTINGETTKIPDGHKKYCQAYDKGNIVYNYYAGTEFEPVDKAGKKLIDETFNDDATVGRGWKLSELSDEERKTIFQNADHNLYFDGDKLIQVRYRTRVAALNLFNNFFRGTSEYMSEGLRFQGSSPVTSRIVTQEIGEYTSQDGDGSQAGQPILETIQIFAGGNLVQASNPKSLLYKEGKLFDDALFTVEEKTDLSANGYVHAIPIAIVNRRNQGVYHPEFNENGTGFFINGIHVAEDKKDFADDITGFTLVDENAATLETASTGRDRKAKFKVMLTWLFSTDYKAGGSMVSRTTYRPDGLLYDEINTRDIIDLRIDANDQRKRIEDLEADVAQGYKELYATQENMAIKVEQTNNYINTTANLIYTHIGKVESSVRKDMKAKDDELTKGQELTNTNLADLSANVFNKDVSTNLLIDTITSLVFDMDTDAFDTWKNSGPGSTLSVNKPDRDYISGIIKSLVENTEGPYTKPEFMKFLVTVLKSVVSKTMLGDDALDIWIKRLSVKDLSMDATDEIYSRAESLELIYEGLTLASGARILPPVDSDKLENWVFAGKRYKGWLGSRHLDLTKDFLESGETPVAVKDVKVTNMTKTYRDRLGKTWNKGYIAGPTVWGNVHHYHAIYTAWIFVETPFKLDHVKMNGDDPHAIYINEERIASSKYCCRDTAYSYEFSVAGWYRIDAIYSECGGGHAVQLGWNPKDYQDKIKYMTTANMDEAVRITKLRLDNWASKSKSLVSTIKGDASGYFTKLETKLILIAGLQKIVNNILTYGTNITASELKLFHTGSAVNPDGLEWWLDTSKFTDLGYKIQDGKRADGTTYTRSDLFRPIPDLTGFYNKDEIVEIVKRSLELSNGIDSINSTDLQKWVDRLNIGLPMESGVRYYTKTQVDTLIKDGSNYLAGLDSVTSYEIAAWIDNHISNYNIGDGEGQGGTDVNRVFTDANGKDLSVTTTDNVYTKSEFKTLIADKTKKILGAQSAKTSS